MNFLSFQRCNLLSLTNVTDGSKSVGVGKLVKTGPIWSKLVQTGINWSNLVQTCSDWSRLFKTGPNWSLSFNLYVLWSDFFHNSLFYDMRFKEPQLIQLFELKTVKLQVPGLQDLANTLSLKSLKLPSEGHG